MPPISISQKLKIHEGTAIMVLNPPEDYRTSLGELPSGVKIADSLKSCQQIHWFVKNRAQMEKELDKVLTLLKEGVICWIFYPKVSSGIQTDLTRDKGWDQLLKLDLQWVNLVSFNETWSAFGMRLKNEADKQRAAEKKPRPIFDYVDPVKKTVSLPEDFDKALKKNQKREKYFHSLAFSHKKEYLEWIISAKKEETRNRRIQSAMDMMDQQWKNPSNR